MATAPVAVQVVVNQADIDRIARRLDKWQGKPLADRMDKATQGGMRILVGPIRGLAPVGATGNLRASVAVRKLRKRPGEVSAYKVGPAGRQGAHRHLVIRGHRMVGHKPNKTPSGFVTRANPFVSRAADPLEGAVGDFIDAQVRRLA